jgi:hypothetical protein
MSITLQVGSANAQVNSVTFDVTGAAVAPNLPATEVTGVPGAGAPVTSPAGGIQFRLATEGRGVFGQSIRVTADSSGGLACIGGGCGSTVIPFTEIRWDSVNSQTGGTAGLDIASNQFDGSASQLVLNAAAPNFFLLDGMEISNVLVFRYRNTTLYPAGTYRGRVTFTAATP